MKNRNAPLRKPLIVLALLLSSTLFSFGQDNTTYKTSLKEMMDASGAAGTYRVAITQTIKMLKSQRNTVPETIWEDFEATFQKSAQEDLFDLLLPIYQKNLTETDLKAITAFYRTPSGKKLAEKTPFIMQESMQAGQQWGMKLGEEFTKKLKEKGY